MVCASRQPLLTPALGILRKRDRRLTAVLALPPYLDPTRVLERPVSDVQAEYAPHDIKQPWKQMLIR
jgi:hypothetical protein